MSKDIESTSCHRTTRMRVVVAACALAATVSLAPLAAHAAPAAAGAQPTVGTACRSACAQAGQALRAYVGACLGCLGQGLAGTGAGVDATRGAGAARGACPASTPGACAADAGCTGYVDVDADGVCDNAGTGAGAGSGIGTGAKARGACRPDGRAWRQTGVGDVTQGGFRGTSASPVRGSAR